MNIELTSDFPVNDDACKAATGKTLTEWAELIAANDEIASKRRPAISWICDQVGRGVKDVWWATTIWVEYERATNRTQKDGLFEGYSICSTKTINAPISKVMAALLPHFPNVTRVREGKDIRAVWQTPGVAHETPIDVAFTDVKGKTGVNIMQSRMQTREETDGMRAAWAAVLDQVKKDCEG